MRNSMYQVTTGIFQSHQFNGTLSKNRKVIWDNDSFGRGYPVENCQELAWVSIEEAIIVEYENGDTVKTLAKKTGYSHIVIKEFLLSKGIFEDKSNQLVFIELLTGRSSC